MTKEVDWHALAAELRAAFELGFFSRHFDPDVLDDALNVLFPRLARSIFDCLKEGKQGSGTPAKRSRPLIAAAERALAPEDPCRPLYHLGAALGEYYLRQLAGLWSPDPGQIWDIVGRIPEPLLRESGCLHKLAEEAKGDRDLEDVFAAASRTIREMLWTDDQDKYVTNYRIILSGSPDWMKRVMPTDSYRPLVAFVSKLDRELAEFATRKRPEVPMKQKDKEVAPSEKFVPTDFQRRILRALDKKGLKKQELAAEVCGEEGSRLYKPGGIKELMELDLVRNKRGVGYYRPDAPPPIE
jgi:hypothetical protein